MSDNARTRGAAIAALAVYALGTGRSHAVYAEDPETIASDLIADLAYALDGLPSDASGDSAIQRATEYRADPDDHEDVPVDNADVERESRLLIDRLTEYGA